jgi:hypothetical protein
VVDGIFGSAAASALRQEIVSLFQHGLMHKNCTHLVKVGDQRGARTDVGSGGGGQESLIRG